MSELSPYDITSAPDTQSENADKGVVIRPSANTLKITYTGLLADSGAQEIMALVGHGDNSNWENTTYYPMKKTDEKTFELNLPYVVQENLNIAFKDNSENWDNNSGSNYQFHICEN